MLRAYVAMDKSSWADWLHLLEFTYNNSVHGSTGTTLYFLLYGFNPKTPLDFLAQGSQTEPKHPEAKQSLKSI
jgi:hypothetical protein